MNTHAIKKAFDAATKPEQIHEAILYIENSAGDDSERFSYGGRKIDTPMVIASITKMFTTTCILKICEQCRLNLDDRISLYLDKELLSGLHVYKGHEYSFDLTLSNLLFQSSGLPDNFESNNQNVSTFMNAILKEDTYLTLDQALTETKSLTPRFAPDGKKAYYSNMNFDLMGEILEKVTELPLNEIYKQFIFAPLGMDNTYLPVNEDDFVPSIYFKSQRIERPKLITSCKASGGCVSTPKDLMAFSKGFWEGKLFDKKIFDSLAVYRKLQMSKGPINYGGGYMQISLGGISTMFIGEGELIGHSGATGSFAFYNPKKDLHMVGDLAQMANPAAPIRLLMRLAMAK